MSTFWSEKHNKYYFKKTSVPLTEVTFMSNKYVKLEELIHLKLAEKFVQTLNEKRNFENNASKLSKLVRGKTKGAVILERLYF